MQVLALVLAGVVTGVLSMLFGTGGGVILAPLLVSFFGLSVTEAAATTLAALVPASLLGAYLHARVGHVDFPRAALLAMGMFVGLQVGAAAGRYLPEASLRRLFGVFLLVLALRFLR